MGESTETTAQPTLDRESTAPAGQGLTSLVAASVSFALLVAAGAFQLGHLGTGVEATVILYGFLGLGSAPLQLSRQFSGLRFMLLAISIGVSGVIMVGFLLIETRTWGAAPPLFWALGAAAGLVHLNAVRLNRSSLAGLPRRPPPMSRVSALAIAGAVVGFGACLAGALRSVHMDPNKWGLGGTISPIWWVGLIVLIGTFLFAWGKDSRVVGVLGVLCGAVLTGTASFVYDVARYSWTQGHVGITQYFLTYGHTNPDLHTNATLNIYQSWPGFFAGIAWLCSAAGVHNVEAIARWWPFAADMVCLFGLRYIAGLLGLDRRQAWLAALLFTASNTVGQDYYSPQSVVYMLAILALGLVIRSPGGERRGYRWDVWTFVLVSAAIGVTHQITPYILFGELLILMFFRLTTSRWLPLIPLFFGLAWALDNLSLVLKFYRVSGVGNIAVNIKPPSSSRGYHYPLAAHVSLGAEVAAPIAVGLLALLALYARRDRLALALGVVAASAGALLVVVHYGAEDILRVALFAVPWLALLAAYGCPLFRRTRAGAGKHRLVRWRRTAPLGLPPTLRTPLGVARRYGYPVMVLALTPCVVLGYVLGDLGADYANAVRAGDLSAEQYFEHHAPAHSKLIVLGQGGVPTNSTAHYTRYGFRSLRMASVTASTAESDASTFTKYLISSIESTKRHKNVELHFYVLEAQQAIAKTIFDGTAAKAPYTYFLHALLRQSGWSVIDRTSTATLAKFTPPAVAHPEAAKASISASPNPVALGGAVTIVAAVSLRYGGGTFTFYTDGHSITGCTAVPLGSVAGSLESTCTTSSLPKGSQVVRAIYNAPFVTASAALHVTVNSP